MSGFPRSTETIESNGTVVGSRGALNFIAGANVTLTIVDNAAAGRVDVTIAASAGGGGSPAAPAFVFSTSNVQGVATTFVPSDSTIALFDATNPAALAFGGAAAVGAAGLPPRRDHGHAMPAAAVTTNGLTMATAKILGRVTAGTGALEELAPGGGLSLSAGAIASTTMANDTLWSAAGDLPVATGNDAGAVLAVGANGTFLSPVAGTPAWVANPVGTSWTTVRKTGDETVNNSSTLQNDDELFFTAANGSAYEIQLFLLYNDSAGGTADLKASVGEDATVRGAFTSIGLSTSDTAQATNILANQSAVVSLGTATTTRGVELHGAYVGAGGTFRLKWAQNTANVSDTKVLTGSVIRYRVIS